MNTNNTAQVDHQQNPELPAVRVTDLDLDSDSKFVGVMREHWIHEDDLIDQRMKWLLVSETILFAAYSALLATYCQTGDSLVLSLIGSIPYIAIIIALVILGGIGAAVMALWLIRVKVKKRFTSQALRVLEERIYVNFKTSVIGALCPLLMPILAICIWITILMFPKTPKNELNRTTISIRGNYEKINMPTLFQAIERSNADIQLTLKKEQPEPDADNKKSQKRQ